MTKHHFLLCLILLGWGWSAIAGTSLDQSLRHGAIGLDKLSNIENGKVVSGFKYDLIEELGRRLGWTTDHQLCPFQRCLRAMKNGRVNIMVFIAVTPLRRHYLDFLHIWPVPYTIPFYVRRGEEDQLRHYEDFYSLNVGVVNGYSYFDRFDSDTEIHKTIVLKESQLPKMLSARRIDAYAGFNIGREDLEKEYPNIIAAPYTHQFSETALLAISKASPLSEHLPELEMAVHNMIDDGTLDQIWYNNFKGYSPPYYNESDTGQRQEQQEQVNQGTKALKHAP